jgi:SAM-dependent methyltransferase
MFWFNRSDPRAIFVDNRRETNVLRDRSSAGGSRILTVNPDLIADFTELPFPSNRFAMVVFDPPHLIRAGLKGWQAKKYGKLDGDWKKMLRCGFLECFRVLRPEGTLIFKWSEHDIPVNQILALTNERPLFGQRCGKSAKTHWIVFMKGFTDV